MGDSILPKNAGPLKSALKRDPSSRPLSNQQKAVRQNANSTFRVPEGLRALLNDITKEVLCGQPEPNNIFGFCADYLEGRVEERDHLQDEVTRPTTNLIKEPQQEDPNRKKKLNCGKKEAERATTKMLQREGTFNIYANDSDSGVESSTTGQGEQDSPSLELAIQRLAETIKEFDIHSQFKEDEDSCLENKTDVLPPKWSLGVDRPTSALLTSDTDESEVDGHPDDEGHIVLLDIHHPAPTEPGITNMPSGTRVEFLISRGTVLRLPPSDDRTPAQELHWQMLPHTTIPVNIRRQDEAFLFNVDDSKMSSGTPLHSIRSITSDLPGSPLSLSTNLDGQSNQHDDLNGNFYRMSRTVPAIELNLQFGPSGQPPGSKNCVVTFATTQTEEELPVKVVEVIEKPALETSDQEIQTDITESRPPGEDLKVETKTREVQTEFVQQPGDVQNPVAVLDVQVVLEDSGCQTEAGTEEEKAEMSTTSTQTMIEEVPTSGCDQEVQTEMIIESSYPMHYQPPIAYSISPGDDLSDINRTRTVSPQSETLWSPPVQDNVVARVLLEHVGGAFAQPDPRRAVNYLDLSRLGEEGETPASDEIWLTVGAAGEDDKFLTSDSDTYSVATDKLSTAATIAGHLNQGVVNLLDSPSASGMSENELLGAAEDLYCESFDAEAEATARLQGVLAGELVPLQSTLKETGKSVDTLSFRFNEMESVLNTLCHTVATLQSQLNKEDRPKSSTLREMNEKRAQMSSREQALVDQLVARIEHLSVDVSQMEASRQLKEDNLLLRKDLQAYQEREQQMLGRMDTLEKRLFDIQEKGSSKKNFRPRRKSSDSDNTVAFPPITTNSRSKSTSALAADPDNANNTAASHNEADIELEANKKAKDIKNNNLHKIVKPSLIPPNRSLRQSTKLQRSLSSSSSTSGSEKGLSCKTRPQPIVAKLTADILQSELESTQMDNQNLRQDILDYKERESQLLKRAKDLEDTFAQQASTVLALVPSGAEVEDDVKSEIKLNIDFIENLPDASMTNSTHQDVPKPDNKKTFSKPQGPTTTTEKKQAKMPQKSSTTTKASPPATVTAPPAPQAIASVKPQQVKPASRIPKRDNSKEKVLPSSGESSSSLKKSDSVESSTSVDSETKSEDLKPPDTSGKVQIEKKALVPAKKAPPPATTKSKPLTQNGNGKPKPVKVIPVKTSNASNQPPSTVTAVSKSEEISSTDLTSNNFNVTVSTKHQMDTVNEPPQKVVVVTPKQKVEQKKATASVNKQQSQKKAEVKTNTVKKTTTTTDARSDPIPKPVMFPAARPARGLMSQKVASSSSHNLATSQNKLKKEGISSMSHLAVSCPSIDVGLSGRMSVDSDHSDVIQMVIKQEPRGNSVESLAPPMGQIRESPDGMNSSMLDGWKGSGRTSVIFDCEDAMAHNSSSDGFERDIIMEFVLQEEMEIDAKHRESPFKRYTEKVREKIVREHLLPARARKSIKPASVAKTRSRLKRRTLPRARSLSTENETSKTSGYSTSNHHSMERLPTLSAFDEERIVWLKHLEDDIAFSEERRMRNFLKRQQAEEVQATSTATSSSPSSPSTCISRASPNRPGSKKIVAVLPTELTPSKSKQSKGMNTGDNPDSINLDTGINTGDEAGQTKDEEDQESSAKDDSETARCAGKEDAEVGMDHAERKKKRWSRKKERDMAKERREKTRSKSRKAAPVSRQSPFTAECFLLSRGNPLDQCKLLRCLDRIKCANFNRIQNATTINRVVESIRPHIDVVVIHIGNQELVEAAHSVVSVTEAGENIRDSSAIGLSVAGSLATVISRHIMTAANQNRATQFVVSLPLPLPFNKGSIGSVGLPDRNASEVEIQYSELRKTFNSILRANCCSCSNVQCADNENLALSNLPPVSKPVSRMEVEITDPVPNPVDNPESMTPVPQRINKYLNESLQLTSAGMRKMTKNWETCLSRIQHAPDGQLVLRRSSESGSTSAGQIRQQLGMQGSNHNSSSGSSRNELIVQKVPWRPY